MPALYLTAIRPNPPGRNGADDTEIDPALLNEEWVEFEVRWNGRPFGGEELYHLIRPWADPVGQERLARFPAIAVRPGQRVRVHTGAGEPTWQGNVLHWFLGRSRFAWSSTCGDRALLVRDLAVADCAEYGPLPPQGVLTRVAGTNMFVPSLKSERTPYAASTTGGAAFSAELFLQRLRG